MNPPISIKIISTFVFLFARLMHATYRYRYINDHNRLKAIELGGGKFCYGIWHQNIMACILSQTGRRHVVMVSPSNDGTLVADTLTKLGHTPVRGSSSRRGKEAMIELLKVMDEQKIPCAISVDGPKGPARIAKKGVAVIANLSNSPILPLAAIAENFWFFPKAWDQFRIPKPFSIINVVYLEPIVVESNDEAYIEETLLKLKKVLDDADKKYVLVK